MSWPKECAAILPPDITCVAGPLWLALFLMFKALPAIGLKETGRSEDRGPGPRFLNLPAALVICNLRSSQSTGSFIYPTFAGRSGFWSPSDITTVNLGFVLDLFIYNRKKVLFRLWDFWIHSVPWWFSRLRSDQKNVSAQLLIIMRERNIDLYFVFFDKEFNKKVIYSNVYLKSPSFNFIVADRNVVQPVARN